MSPIGLQHDSKNHPKKIEIALGSHLEKKKKEKLNLGCYLLYLRHVGLPLKPSKFEPLGKEDCHKMHHEIKPAKKSPKSHQHVKR